MNPEEQFEKMLNYAVVPSKKMPFPLTEQSFEAFGRLYQPINTSLDVQCELVSVLSDKDEKISAQTSEERPFHVMTESEAASKVCVERCCRETFSETCVIQKSCISL